MKGDSVGVGVFILAILCLGIVGVFMYYKAETNSYNALIEKIQAMQTEIHSNADSIKQINETLKKHEDANNAFLDLGQTATNNFQKVYTDLEKIEGRLSTLREAQRNERSKPLMLDLKWPTSPMPVEITKVPERKRFYQSETTVEKTKTGLIHKTSGKAIEKTHVKTHPAIRQSKQMMKAFDDVQPFMDL